MTTPSPQLLPCPFCGEMPHLKGTGDPPFWLIQCVQCGAMAASEADELDAAIASWNRRPTSAAGGEGWKPIESAPKGKHVLVGRHMKDWGFIRGTGYYGTHGGISGWICRGISDPPGELGLGNPTLWHPLPADPADGDEVKG